MFVLFSQHFTTSDNNNLFRIRTYFGNVNKSYKSFLFFGASKMKNIQSCCQCGCLRDFKTDYSFLEQETTEGVKSFCSTQCIYEFFNLPENQHQLVLRPCSAREELKSVKPLTETELKQVQKDWDEDKGTALTRRYLYARRLRFKIRLRLNYIDGGPRVCSVCCTKEDLKGLSCEDLENLELKYANLAGVLQEQVCSTECALTVLQNKQWSAVGYWLNPETPRCDHCNLVYRTDEEGNVGYGSITINANCRHDPFYQDVSSLVGHGSPAKELHFCSAKCAADHLERSEDPGIYWVEKQNICSEVGSCYGCDSQENKDLPGPFIALSAPYASTLDAPMAPWYFCSIPCIVRALRSDQKSMEDNDIGPWYRDYWAEQNPF